MIITLIDAIASICTINKISLKILRSNTLSLQFTPCKDMTHSSQQLMVVFQCEDEQLSCAKNCKFVAKDMPHTAHSSYGSLLMRR